MQLGNVIPLGHSAYVGLELQLGGSDLYRAVKLGKKRNQLNIDGVLETTAALDEVVAFAGNQPVVLSLSGKGIITKRFPIHELEDERTVLHGLLPNASASDFYLQYYTAGEHFFASIMRKEQVDAVVNGLREKGLQVVRLNFAPLLADLAKPLLPNVAERIELSTAVLEYQDDVLTAIGATADVASRTYRIGEESLPSENLVAFSGAFEALLPSANAHLPEVPAVVHGEKEARERLRFLLLGKALLVFFLLVLLVNYFVFSSYQGKYQELEASSSVNLQQVRKLDDMREDLSHKEQLIQSAGILSHSRSAWMADQLAGTVPSKISLSALHVEPIVPKARVEERQQFERGIVLVYGSTDKAATLNDWITAMKGLDWIKQVDIVNFEQNPQLRAGDFSLRITLKS